MGLEVRQRALLITLSLIAIISLIAISSALESLSSSGQIYNISGKWDMIGNEAYRFSLDLKQNGDLIKGTITRTNGVEPVDAIDGRIYSDARIEFSRVRPNQWTQTYAGRISPLDDGTLKMSGTFTQTGAPGEYSWNATLIRANVFRNNLLLPSGIIKPALAGAVDQEKKMKVPILILPNKTFSAMPSINRTLPSIQAQGSGAAGNAKLVASPSIPEWKGSPRALISSLLAINQTAILEFEDGSDFFIDSDSDNLVAKFKWSPSITASALAPASAVWQVSTMPFPDDPINWANPPGLLAKGNLRADERKFTVDFSQLTPTDSEVAHYWAKSIPHLLFQKKILTTLKSAASAKLATVTSSHEIQAYNDVIAKMDQAVKQIDASPIMNTARAKMISNSTMFSGLPNLKANTNALTTVHPILKTMSVSPLKNISLQRVGLQRGLPSLAQTGGAAGNADKKGVSLFSGLNAGIHNGIINSGLSLSKASLLYALPQTQRTYYVRVVLLDVKGNCTGMPSEEKEVIVGKPIVEAAGDSENMVKLGVTFTSYKPRWSQDMCDGYYVEDDVSMDWNQDLNRWFIWKSDLTNLAEAEWQVSQAPFDNVDPMNPSGLVARGKLNIDPADLTKKGSCAGEGVHEFSIDFSKFAPAPDPNNPLKIQYYVRVIALAPLNSAGRFLGYLSPPRTITYGQPDQQKIVTSECVQVKVVQPDVKILSYSPIHNQQSDAEYHWIATKDNPETDIGSFKQGSLWRAGDHVDFTPKDEGWWDEVVDFFESIVDFFADIINWVSNAWDTLKNDCINAIAGAICLGDSDCTGALTPIVSGGLDAGLMAMGIPPEIPNFDQLANMGEEYLVKTIAAEAGVNPELADLVTPEDIKKGVDVFVQESSSGGSAGLIPDPNYQYRPAFMTVQISNSQSEPTLPGTLDISDTNMVFKPKLGSVPIPSLQPGETMTFPIFFEKVPETIITYGSTVMYENCFYDENGNPERGPNGEICYDDWLTLYAKSNKFTATAHCDPGIDIQALEEQLGKKYVGTQGLISFGDMGSIADTFYIQYQYEGQNSQEVEITPNQPWSA